MASYSASVLYEEYEKSLEVDFTVGLDDGSAWLVVAMFAPMAAKSGGGSKVLASVTLTPVSGLMPWRRGRSRRPFSSCVRESHAALYSSWIDRSRGTGAAAVRFCVAEVLFLVTFVTLGLGLGLELDLEPGFGPGLLAVDLTLDESGLRGVLGFG